MSPARLGFPNFAWIYVCSVYLIIFQELTCVSAAKVCMTAISIYVCVQYLYTSHSLWLIPYVNIFQILNSNRIIEVNLKTVIEREIHYVSQHQIGLGGLVVTCSPRDPRFACSNPAEVDGFFQSLKSWAQSSGRHFKLGVPSLRFQAR